MRRTDNKFHQLVRLEESEHSSSAHFVEALIESIKMFRHRFVENEINIEVHIFLPSEKRLCLHWLEQLLFKIEW